MGKVVGGGGGNLEVGTQSPMFMGFFWRERNACYFDRQDLSVAKLKIFIVKVLK